MAPRNKGAGAGAAPRRATSRTPARPPLAGLCTRRIAILLWIGAAGALAALVLVPVSNGVTRLGGAILAGSLCAGLLGLWWRYPFLRWSLLALYAAAGGFWALPGRTLYDRDPARDATARALRRYEGVRYHLGGESRFGIDCSGLIRRGAIEGAFREGLRTRNPWLVRKAVRLWWHDLSAREMGLGARRQARRLVQAKAIKGFDDSLLRPGDFAITEGGVHALAYLGDHLWIEADPSEGKVIVVDSRTTSNPWFQGPVSILRWRFLQAPRRRHTATR